MPLFERSSVVRLTRPDSARAPSSPMSLFRKVQRGQADEARQRPRALGADLVVPKGRAWSRLTRPDSARAPSAPMPLVPVDPTLVCLGQAPEASRVPSVLRERALAPVCSDRGFRCASRGRPQCAAAPPPSLPLHPQPPSPLIQSLKNANWIGERPGAVKLAARRAKETARLSPRKALPPSSSRPREARAGTVPNSGRCVLRSRVCSAPLGVRRARDDSRLMIR